MVKVKGAIKAKINGVFVKVPIAAGGVGGGEASKSELFDATELYIASRSQSKEITPEFMAALLEAISLDKILYISDDTIPEYKVSVVIGFIEKTSEKITFAATGKGYNYNIILDAATRRVDTTAVKVGSAFNKYINSKNNDIFSLTMESTPEQVRAVFDLNGEGPVLPNAGDTFEVYENTVAEPNLSDSGVVVSRKASPTTQELNIISNNFEDQLIVIHNIVIDYGVNGFNNNVRVTNVTHSVIDPSVITDEFIHALDANISAVKNEINEFNISAINGTPYASLQEAVSALSSYLGERQKMVGIKITYAEAPSNLPKTYAYKGGSFVNVGSWIRDGLTPVVNHPASETTATITPNEFHVWGEVPSLDITLGLPSGGAEYREYFFEFKSPAASATTLSLPQDVKWDGGKAPQINTGKVYQINILNNIGIVLEV